MQILWVKRMHNAKSQLKNACGNPTQRFWHSIPRRRRQDESRQRQTFLFTFENRTLCPFSLYSNFPEFIAAI